MQIPFVHKVFKQKKSQNIFDDNLIQQVTQEFLAKNIPLETIQKVLSEVLSEKSDIAKPIISRLLQTMPTMLANRQTLKRSFYRRLRKKWGKSFDLLRALIECSREIGEEFYEDYLGKSHHSETFVVESLIRLQARACLLCEEILCLLEGGFASGAMARWRTLHEIMVVSCFINEHGSVVAERYLLHQEIESYKAAIQYQKYHQLLGEEPIRDLEILKQARDALCNRFGESYATDWGWAADVLGIKKPTFLDIEKAISQDFLRPFYKLASYSNHAGSKGTFYDLGKDLIPSDEDVMLAGASDAGLCIPGIYAVNALSYITNNLLVQGDVSAIKFIIIHTITQLSEKTVNSFINSDEKLRIESKKRQEWWFTKEIST